MFKKQDAEGRHRKRFNKPVYHQRNAQAFGFFSDIFDRTEINIYHHWIDHYPNKKTTTRLTLAYSKEAII